MRHESESQSSSKLRKNDDFISGKESKANKRREKKLNFVELEWETNIHRVRVLIGTDSSIRMRFQNTR